MLYHNYEFFFAKSSVILRWKTFIGSGPSSQLSVPNNVRGTSQAPCFSFLLFQFLSFYIFNPDHFCRSDVDGWDVKSSSQETSRGQGRGSRPALLRAPRRRWGTGQSAVTCRCQSQSFGSSPESIRLGIKKLIAHDTFYLSSGSLARALFLALD